MQKRKAKPAVFDSVDKKHIKVANYELGQMWEATSEMNARIGHIEGIVEEGFKSGTGVMNDLSAKIDKVTDRLFELPCENQSMRITNLEKTVTKSMNIWNKIKWYILTTIITATASFSVAYLLRFI
jgi:hypothetical protein